MSTLILDHHVAPVLWGETDGGLCGQSCLNSGTPNQSSPSVSVSHCSLVLSTQRWRSGAVKSWEWTIRVQPKPLWSLQLISLSLSLCWLYTLQPYYPARPVFSSHVQCWAVEMVIQFFRYPIPIPELAYGLILSTNPIPPLQKEIHIYNIFLTAVYYYPCLDVIWLLLLLYGLAQVKPFVKHEQIQRLQRMNTRELSFIIHFDSQSQSIKNIN